ncbi:MAG: lysylphosphatidylglycerol synthase transmembrane domain-containing protein [Candidatus Omnitrophota bacterium]
MRQKIKRIIIEFVRIGVGVLIIFVLLKKVDIQKIFHIILNINIWFFLLALFTYIFNTILCLNRWQMLLVGANVNLSLRRTAVSFLTGLFFNLFLPSAIGGDVIRTMHLSGHTRKPKEVAATVLLDRLSGSIGMVFIAVIAVLIGGNCIKDVSVFISVAILFFLLTAGLLVIFNNFIYTRINHFLRRGGKIKEMIRELHNEIYLFKNRPQIIINNLIMSLLIQFTAPVAFYILSIALNYHINFIYFLIFVPIVSAISMLPISIGGLGLREASLMFFFTRVGLSGEHGFILSLLIFFFSIVVGLIGGVVYVITFHPRWIQYNSSHTKT